MNTVSGCGSSSVFKSAFCAAGFIRSASSMMKTFIRASNGERAASGTTTSRITSTGIKGPSGTM
jgi:hypothetical protein